MPIDREKYHALMAARERAHGDEGVRRPAMRFIRTFFGGDPYRTAAYFDELACLLTPPEPEPEPEPQTWEGDYA